MGHVIGIMCVANAGKGARADAIQVRDFLQGVIKRATHYVCYYYPLLLAFRLSAVLFAFAMALAGKLFYFVIERAAEPVSNILERQAASKSPIFRSACMRLARWQSRFEYNREVRRVVKMQKDAGIEPEPGHAHWVPTDDIEPPPELSEEEATQKGAELLGEAFVIFIALGMLYAQSLADDRSEAEQDAKQQQNEARIVELEQLTASLKEKLEAIEQQAAATEELLKQPPVAVQLKL